MSAIRAFAEYARTGDSPYSRVSTTQLVLEFHDLARALARRVSRPGEPIDDLEQVALSVW